MGLREEMGGKLEDVLNKLVDEKLKGVSLDALKAKVHEEINALIDKHLGSVVDGLAERLKKDVIDLIDGQDDIK